MLKSSKIEPLAVAEPTLWALCPARTGIGLGVRQARSWSSLFARGIGVHSEDSERTGWAPGLVWVFAGLMLVVLVSPGGRSLKEMELPVK